MTRPFDGIEGGTGDDQVHTHNKCLVTNEMFVQLRSKLEVLYLRLQARRLASKSAEDDFGKHNLLTEIAEVEARGGFAAPASDVSTGDRAGDGAGVEIVQPKDAYYESLLDEEAAPPSVTSIGAPRPPPITKDREAIAPDPAGERWHGQPRWFTPHLWPSEAGSGTLFVINTKAHEHLTRSKSACILFY